MKRFALTPRTAPANFWSFYWRKDELVRFCRRHGLPGTGAKAEVAARIGRFLETGEMPQRKQDKGRRASAADRMPDELRRETVVGTRWRCGERLRDFFVREIGPHFHFNQAMRDFFRQGAGRTLQEGIDLWNSTKSAPRGKSVIAPQFKYNRHMREFFRENPGKSLREAIAAWRKKKAVRRAKRGGGSEAGG